MALSGLGVVCDRHPELDPTLTHSRKSAPVEMCGIAGLPETFARARRTDQNDTHAPAPASTGLTCAIQSVTEPVHR
jgi:hypothetical protein